MQSTQLFKRDNEEGEKNAVFGARFIFTLFGHCRGMVRWRWSMKSSALLGLIPLLPHSA